MNKRIIIIEDNKKIREGFVAVVESSGRYDVISQYSNCEDAISLLQEDAPDVVLMDIGLPGMSGLEGSTRIKKRLPACIILIITVITRHKPSNSQSSFLPSRCPFTVVVLRHLAKPPNRQGRLLSFRQVQ